MSVYVNTYSSNAEINVNSVWVHIDSAGFDEFECHENMDNIIDFVSEHTELTDGQKEMLIDKLDTWVSALSKPDQSRYSQIISVYNGCASFLSDNEKMHDFITLSMDEFLESYSYLSEGDYYATYDALMNLVKKGEKNDI